MKTLNKSVLILIGFLILNSCNKPIEKTYGKYQHLPFGSIEPKGWITNQMERDLDSGLTGHFDKFGKTVTYDLFVNQNRTSEEKYGGLKCWWSGEHEGYWKDGVLRSAFLINDSEFKTKATKWMEDILSNIDESGYIGIYSKESRYNHTGENGELWSQSRILMPLIAYYEFTKDERVLKAIEKSVQLTMDAYSNKTAWIKGEGGVSHGIGYFEVLEWLHRTTDNKAYATFSKYLYNDFNESKIRDFDLQKQHLLDMDTKFKKHGAHIAEGFFVPQYIAELTKNDTMKLAANNAMDKLNYHTTPGGAMVCAEDVKQTKGSADEYYEYCTTTEFLNPLGIILSNTGDFTIADRMEKTTFNALQGGRLHDLKALSYITAENRLNIDPSHKGARETYDAYHRAAACCALNGGRVMPYFVQHMWKKDHADITLTAMLYGPNELNTEIAGTKIKIVEDTNYPFSDKVTFNMELEAPTAFELVLRKPHNCSSLDIDGIDKKDFQVMDDRVIISRKWDENSSFEVSFNFDVEKKSDNDKIYLQRGPLVYTLPFEYETDTLKTHKNTKFHQFAMHVKDSTGSDYMIPSDSKFQFKTTGNMNFDFPFDTPLVSLNGNMATKEGEIKNVELVPLGNTVIRMTSFKQQ